MELLSEIIIIGGGILLQKFYKNKIIGNFVTSVVHKTTSYVKTYINDTYKEYCALHSLIKANYSNPVSLHIGMTILLLTARKNNTIKLYHKYCKKYQNIRISRALKSSEDSENEFSIDYVFNDKNYRIQINIKSEFEEIISVKDENKNNVLKHINIYLGPNHDFHGQKYTPKNLGYSSLIFCNGLQELTFKDDEEIHLKFEK